MSDLPQVAPGYVRLMLYLPRNQSMTPGDVARATGLNAELLGPIILADNAAAVDVVAAHGRQARAELSRIGTTQLFDRNWVWLRLAIGRNHGFAMGQFRKVMATAGAKGLGRIVIQNTHTMVGLPDDVAETIRARLEREKINGYPVRPSILPPKAGPGSPEFVRGT
jgi:hypothetical protein